MLVGEVISEGTVQPEPMEFRPVRPPLRQLWPLAILSPIFLLIAPGILADPTPERLVGLAGTGSLILGGIYLWFRQRIPGDPTLRIDAAGMIYARGDRERGLKWTEVAEILVDFTLDRMLFVPTSGGKPIVMHRNMVSADGRRWDMLIETYWQPPVKRRHRECG